MSKNFNNLTHHILLASPNIDEGIFHQSLVYICRHDPQGVLGLIINKPIQHSHITKLFEELDVNVTDPKLYQKTPLDGGPMNPEVGFVLHTGQPHWSSSFAITENVCITTSKDILYSLGIGQGVEHFELCLGHTSWVKGQLEQEISQGDWLVMPANSRLLFEVPHAERWQVATDQLGVNFDKFSTDIGHA
ncbi:MULTISPECIES: YqgE/AlgH family protein [unclassified Moraxella]|uniref:YqgE/AlgH family protein n=1 Tax=unclassified Moraxella TaxID=2685852 RepID=UPI003AF62296